MVYLTWWFLFRERLCSCRVKDSSLLHDYDSALTSTSCSQHINCVIDNSLSNIEAHSFSERCRRTKWTLVSPEKYSFTITSAKTFELPSCHRDIYFYVLVQSSTRYTETHLNLPTKLVLANGYNCSVQFWLTIKTCSDSGDYSDEVGLGGSAASGLLESP